MKVENEKKMEKEAEEMEKEKWKAEVMHSIQEQFAQAAKAQRRTPRCDGESKFPRNRSQTPFCYRACRQITKN